MQTFLSQASNLSVASFLEANSHSLYDASESYNTFEACQKFIAYEIRGKYCKAEINVTRSFGSEFIKSTFGDLFSSNQSKLIKTGICVPKICTIEELNELGQKLLPEEITLNNINCFVETVFDNFDYFVV